jgi:hypothetical protein
MKAEGVTSASLSIEVLPIVHFEASFPILAPGGKYKIQFIVNGEEAKPIMPTTFFTPGSVLAWAQINWSNYGTWYIEYLQADGNAIYSDEFSDEFQVPASGYKLIGISNIEGFVGELIITTA